MKEIERQLDMGVNAIADKDRWMLEIGEYKLKEKSLADQQYWLYAVEAARQAGTRAAVRGGDKQMVEYHVGRENLSADNNIGPDGEGGRGG